MFRLCYFCCSQQQDATATAELAPVTPQQLMAREIALRDRNSALVSRKKDFKSVLTFLQDFRRKEAVTSKRRKEETVKDGAKASRYQRPTDEKQIWKEQVGADLEDLGIKTNVYKRRQDKHHNSNGSKHSSSRQSLTSSRPLPNKNSVHKGALLVVCRNALSYSMGLSECS